LSNRSGHIADFRGKAKRDLARKEGRLLTPKQKQERAAAEARKKALLESGVIIEGLNQAGSSTSAPKKVNYGKRQKKAPAPKVAVEAVTEPVFEKQEVETVVKENEEELASDWDKIDDNEIIPAKEEAEIPQQVEPSEATKATEGDDVKSDWDASSDEEEEKLAKKPEPKGNMIFFIPVPFNHPSLS
jgi:translation initiation factor 5B